jgi:hypothetical protein
MGIAKFTDAFRSLINKYFGHSNVATFSDINFLAEQLSLNDRPITVYYKVDSVNNTWGLKAIGASNIFGLLKEDTGLFVPTTVSTRNNDSGCVPCKFKGFQTNSDWSNKGPWFVSRTDESFSSGCVPCWALWADIKSGQIQGHPLRVLFAPPKDTNPQSPFANFAVRVSNVFTIKSDALVINVDRIPNPNNLELQFTFTITKTNTHWKWTYKELIDLVFEVTYLPKSFEGEL